MPRPGQETVSLLRHKSRSSPRKVDPARAAGRCCHLPSLWVWPGAGGAPQAAGKVLQQNPGEVRCRQVGWGLTPSGKEGACRGPGPPLFPLQLRDLQQAWGPPRHLLWWGDKRRLLPHGTYFPCKVSPPFLSPFHLQTLPSGQPPPVAGCPLAPLLLSPLSTLPTNTPDLPGCGQQGPRGMLAGAGCSRRPRTWSVLPLPSSRLPPHH